MSLLHREEIINYLAEIAMGDLSLTLDAIEQESNTETREFLFDFFVYMKTWSYKDKKSPHSTRSCKTYCSHFPNYCLSSMTVDIQMINKQSRDSIHKVQSDIQHQHIGQFLTPLQGGDAKMEIF